MLNFRRNPWLTSVIVIGILLMLGLVARVITPIWWPEYYWQTGTDGISRMARNHAYDVAGQVFVYAGFVGAGLIPFGIVRAWRNNRRIPMPTQIRAK